MLLRNSQHKRKEMVTFLNFQTIVGLVSTVKVFKSFFTSYCFSSFDNDSVVSVAVTLTLIHFVEY
jgi:hypothetical protein